LPNLTAKKTVEKEKGKLRREKGKGNRKLITQEVWRATKKRVLGGTGID